MNNQKNGKYNSLQEIEDELIKKPYLLSFMKTAMSWDKKQIQAAINYLEVQHE